MRKIGDITLIRDADELLVFFYKEEQFYRINEGNFLTFFPKKENGTRCRTCPNFYVKYTGKLATCQTKIESWSQFKVHLAESERIFGELVAFKNGSKLPDRSNFKKHRMYGHLWPFQTKDEFLIYDTRQKKFVKMERKNMTKTYTKKGNCNFCPCDRKLQSSTTIIKHLQVLETRFFCYLMLEDEKYNDSKNVERLNAYLSCVKSKEINNKMFSRRSNFTGNLSKTNSTTNDNLNESECESNMSSGDEGENPMMLLNEFQDTYEKSYERMNLCFSRLKSKLRSGDLNQGVIDSQDQWNLIRRSEDFQEKAKDLTFMRPVKLSCEDLNYLMVKYGLTDDFEISHADVTLNIQMKDGAEIKKELARQISIPISPLSEQQLALTLPRHTRNAQYGGRSVPMDSLNEFQMKEIGYDSLPNLAIEQGSEDDNLENNMQDLNDEQEDYDGSISADEHEYTDGIDHEINQYDDIETNDLDNYEESIKTHETMNGDLIENANVINGSETIEDVFEVHSKENEPDNRLTFANLTKVKLEKGLEFDDDENANVKRMKVN